MKADLLSKLLQVIEQIPQDVLYDFCCSYAQEHEELAMALVNEFWRPEKDDYRSMVQQCLMHPTQSGIKNGDGLLLFEKKQKEMFISLAQRKGTKETSTPSKAIPDVPSPTRSLSPYIGRMQLTPVRDQPLSEFWYDLRSLCPSGKS